MKFESLAHYWGMQKRTNAGKWVHPDDRILLETEQHSFNLDFPAPAFVGDILNAKIIILAANGGYDKAITSQEFSENDSTTNYIDRLTHPSNADWSVLAPYYKGINYSHVILSGRAAIVNACAYRSRKISEEPENKKLIKKMASVAFNKSWLIKCVLPLAKSGERLVIAKRHGLWNLPKDLLLHNEVIFDPAPVSPHLSRKVWDIIDQHNLI